MIMMPRTMHEVSQHLTLDNRRLTATSWYYNHSSHVTVIWISFLFEHTILSSEYLKVLKITSNVS